MRNAEVPKQGCPYFSLWHTYSFGANKKKQPKLLFFYLALCNSSSERSVNEAYSAG